MPAGAETLEGKISFYFVDRLLVKNRFLIQTKLKFYICQLPSSRISL